VPGGSEYQGPSDALDRYTTVVEKAWEVVKGARDPYTSRNGHMFSFSRDRPKPVVCFTHR
jgi:hypothetical protein